MHPLERVLRFRRLTEEQARRELERATQLLRAATAACEREARAVTEQRASLARNWMGESAGRVSERLEAGAAEGAEPGPRRSLLEEAALEFSGWNRTQLEHMCEVERQRIEPLAERYLECRRSLRQTELLIEQQRARERMEQDRKMQADTDEWFTQRNLLRARREARSPIE